MRDLWPHRIGEVSLRAAGAAFFTEGLLPALLCVTGIFIISPQVGIFAVTASLVATLTSALLRTEAVLHRAGLVSFNGFIYGAFYSGLALTQEWIWPGLITGAVLSVPLFLLVQDLLLRRRLELPAGSLPAVILIWAVVLLAGASGQDTAPERVLPAGLNLVELPLPDLGENLKALALCELWPWLRGPSEGVGTLLGIAAIALALLLYSRISFFLSMAGILVGLSVAVAFGGDYGYEWREYVFLAAVPTMIALGGFFVVFTWASVVLSLLACVVAFYVWLGLEHLAVLSGLPPLTAPFMLTCLLFLLPLKILLLLGRLRPVVAVPLVGVGQPEQTRRWYREQLLGARYWKDVIVWSGTHHDRRAEDSLHQGVELLLRHSRITVLSGAGISTESGIPDYRTGYIAWKKYDSKQLRWESFLRDEEARRAYWRMSQDFYTILRTAEPNAGHRAIASLEQMGRLHRLITQNVDRLHHRAGSSPGRIIELHGNEHEVSCLECEFRVSRDEVYWWIAGGVEVPCCPRCQGLLKPDSVAFGQPMPIEESHRALRAASDCDLFIVVGSSLSVQPAASLPLAARRSGAKLLFINLGSTPYDRFADVRIHGRAGDVLPELLRRMQASSYYFRAEQQPPGWGEVL